MNTKTQTVTTEGYPEAGPFETESEAMGAFVPLLRHTVLSVEHREDGWYRTYVVNSTTSICEDLRYRYNRYSTTMPGQKVKGLSIECWKFARDVFKGRRREEG